MSTSLESAIVEIVRGDDVLNSQIGGRVRPVIGHQLDQRPFVTYQATGDEPAVLTNSGPSVTRKGSIEFGIYGDSAADVVTISGSLQRIFDCQAPINTVTPIGLSVMQDKTDIQQATEPGTGKPVYVRVTTFKMLYTPQ